MTTKLSALNGAHISESIQATQRGEMLRLENILKQYESRPAVMSHIIDLINLAADKGDGRVVVAIKDMGHDVDYHLTDVALKMAGEGHIKGAIKVTENITHTGNIVNGLIRTIGAYNALIPEKQVLLNRAVLALSTEKVATELKLNMGVEYNDLLAQTVKALALDVNADILQDNPEFIAILANEISQATPNNAVIPERLWNNIMEDAMSNDQMVCAFVCTQNVQTSLDVREKIGFSAPASELEAKIEPVSSPVIENERTYLTQSASGYGRNSY